MIFIYQLCWFVVEWTVVVWLMRSFYELFRTPPPCKLSNTLVLYGGGCTMNKLNLSWRPVDLFIVHPPPYKTRVSDRLQGGTRKSGKGFSGVINRTIGKVRLILSSKSYLKGSFFIPVGFCPHITLIHVIAHI